MTKHAPARLVLATLVLGTASLAWPAAEDPPESSPEERREELIVRRFLTVLEKSPHRDVQGTACLRLAQFLVNRREKIDLLKDQPELASRYEGLYGKDYIDRLRRQDRAEVIKEAESFCERADKEFGDLKVLYAGTVSEQVKTELFEIRNLSVGKTAPEIASEDQDGKSFTLSDYRGKIVLLYFWSEF